MACQIRWCGHLDDGPHEAVGGGKCPHNEDVHRRKAQGGDPKRGHHIKEVRPSRRGEMV